MSNANDQISWLHTLYILSYRESRCCQVLRPIDYEKHSNKKERIRMMYFWWLSMELYLVCTIGWLEKRINRPRTIRTRFQSGWYNEYSDFGFELAVLIEWNTQFTRHIWYWRTYIQAVFVMKTRFVDVNGAGFSREKQTKNYIFYLFLRNVAVSVTAVVNSYFII